MNKKVKLGQLIEKQKEGLCGALQKHYIYIYVFILYATWVIDLLGKKTE